MKNISKNLIALSFAFGLFALFGVGSAQAYYNEVYPPFRAMSATEYMYYNGTPVPAYQPVTYKRVELTPTYNAGYYYQSTTMVQPYQQPVAYPSTTSTNNAPIVNNYYYGSSTPSSSTASSTKNTTSSTTKTSTTTKSANTGSSSNSNSSGMVAAVQPRTIGTNNNLMASAADSYNPYCYTGEGSNYTNGNNLTALSMRGSGGFMPSSIWQWILAIMLILAIIVIARMIVKSNPHRDPASTPIH